VEKNTEPQKPSETVSSEQPEEAPSLDVFEVPKIPAKAQKLAKELGFDLSGIQDTFAKLKAWTQSVEGRFQVIIENMPNQNQIQGAVEQAIVNIQAKQRAQYEKLKAECLESKSAQG